MESDSRQHKKKHNPAMLAVLIAAAIFLVVALSGTPFSGITGYAVYSSHSQEVYYEINKSTELAIFVDDSPVSFAVSGQATGIDAQVENGSDEVPVVRYTISLEDEENSYIVASNDVAGLSFTDYCQESCSIKEKMNNKVVKLVIDTNTPLKITRISYTTAGEQKAAKQEQQNQGQKANENTQKESAKAEKKTLRQKAAELDGNAEAKPVLLLDRNGNEKGSVEMKDNGNKKDVKVTEQKSSAEIKEISNFNTITAVIEDPAPRDSRAVKTKIFFIEEEISIQSATITLEKKGDVSAVGYCDDTAFNSATLECSNWQRTAIPFEDLGDAIRFTVTHFSTYGGLTEPNQTIIDSTRTEGNFPFENSTGYTIGSNIFFNSSYSFVELINLTARYPFGSDAELAGGQYNGTINISGKITLANTSGWFNMTGNYTSPSIDSQSSHIVWINLTYTEANAAAFNYSFNDSTQANFNIGNLTENTETNASGIRLEYGHHNDSNVVFLTRFDNSLNNIVEGNLPFYNASLNFTGGKFGEGVYINKTASDLKYNISNYPNENGTVEFWLNADDWRNAGNGAWNCSASKFIFHVMIGGNDTTFRCSVSSGATVIFFEMTGASYSQININPNTAGFVLGWNHIAITWNGTPGQTTGTKRIFVNGVQRASETTARVMMISPKNFTIGNYHTAYGSANGVNATIDDFMIYNRAKTAAEILADFQRNNTQGNFTSQTIDTGSAGVNVTKMEWTEQKNPHINDSNTLFLLRFDGNNLSEEGEAPNKRVAADTFYTAGMFNNSFNVSVGGGLNYSATNNINRSMGTVEVWVKTPWANEQPNNKYIFSSNGWGGNNSFTITIPGMTGTPLRVAIYNHNKVLIDTLSYNLNGSWPANKWRHIAYSWNSSEGAWLYLDGDLVDSYSGSWGTQWNGSNYLVVGNYADDFYSSTSFQGNIDDLRIYDRVRTQQEIHLDYMKSDYYVRNSSNAVTWSGWQKVKVSGDTLPANLSSRYIQYQARLFGNGTFTPTVYDVNVSYALETVPTKIYTRTSADNSTWAAWSELNLTTFNITSAPNRYLQYQLRMETEDGNQSSVVSNINLTSTATDEIYLPVLQPPDGVTTWLDFNATEGYQQGHANDSNTSFLARFDSSNTSLSGKSARSGGGFNYGDGKFGPGLAVTKTTGGLQYNVSQQDIFNATQGTIELWVKTNIFTDPSKTYGLFEYQNNVSNFSNDIMFTVAISTPDTYEIRIYGKGGGYGSALTFPVPAGMTGTKLNLSHTFNTWTHLAVAWNSTTDIVCTNGNCSRLYTISGGRTDETDGNISIGNLFLNGFIYGFNGTIDDFRIYNRLRNASEIYNDFINGSITSPRFASIDYYVSPDNLTWDLVSRDGNLRTNSTTSQKLYVKARLTANQTGAVLIGPTLGNIQVIFDEQFNPAVAGAGTGAVSVNPPGIIGRNSSVTFAFNYSDFDAGADPQINSTFEWLRNNLSSNWHKRHYGQTAFNAGNLTQNVTTNASGVIIAGTNTSGNYTSPIIDLGTESVNVTKMEWNDYGIGHVNDSETLFLARFEGTNTTIEGQNALSSTLQGTNAGVTFKNGKFGQAFNSSGAYLTYNSTNNINSTDGTVEFWAMNFNSAFATSSIIFGTYNGTNALNVIQIQRSGGTTDLRVAFYNLTDSPAAGIVTYTNVFPNNTWVHIAVAWNDTNATVYANGVYKGSITTFGRRMGEIHHTFSIGGQSTTLNPFYGLIDDFRIYNRARNATEILQDYNQRIDYYLRNSSDGSAFGPWQRIQTSGDALPANLSSRYLQYQAQLFGNGTLTPMVTEVNFTNRYTGRIGPIFVLQFDGTNDTIDMEKPLKSSGSSSYPGGKYGRAIGSFKESSIALQYNATGNINISQFTIEAWISPNFATDAASNYIINIYNGSNQNQVEFLISKNGLLTASVWNATPNRQFNTTYSFTPTAGTWYHAAVVFNGSNMTMYLNGALVNDTFINGSISNVMSNASIFVGSSGLGGSYFNGSLDEIIIYDSARTYAQINESYLRNAPLYGLNLNYTEINKTDNISVSIIPANRNTNGSIVFGPMFYTNNTAPAPLSIILNATDSTNSTNTTLQAFFTYNDIDGDSMAFNETAWFNYTAGSVTEALEFRNYTKLFPQNTTKNQTWLFSVRVYDGAEWSTWINSTNITIQNTLPENVSSLAVDLSLRLPNATPAIAWSAANDNDTDTVRYIVYVNGTQDFNTTSASGTLGTVTTLADGNTYEWWVQTYDGQDYGPNSSRDLFQMNANPNATNVTIYPLTAYTNDSLSFRYNYSDPDNDPNYNSTYQWYFNNSEYFKYEDRTQADFNQGTHNGTATNATGVRITGTNLSGNYTSAVIYKGDEAVWKKLYWKAQNDSSTNISLYTRTSADGAAWGSWSNLTFSGDGIVNGTNPYLQYQARLFGNETNSPNLILVNATYIVNSTIDAIFVAQFENSADTIDGERPFAQSNVNYAGGRYSKGFLANSSVLRYNTANNFNQTKGAIEFWLRPGSLSADRKYFLFNERGYVDLNNDGYPDIVFSNYYNGTTPHGYSINSTIYWGTSNSFSASNLTQLPTVGAYGNSIADLNNDSYLDIVFNNRFNGTTYNLNSTIYWGTSAGFSASNLTQLPTVGAYGNSIADLNNDGYPDIVFSNYFNGTIWSINSTIYWGTSSGFNASNFTLLPTTGAADNSIADLNKDGYLDIVFSNYYNGTSALAFTHNSTIYWGSSSGFNASNATYLLTVGAQSNSIADLNNDGYLDIVFSGMRNGTTWNINSTIYWGTSTGFSGSNTTNLSTTGASGNSIADLNNDGYLDIIFGGYYSSPSYYLNSTIYWGTSSGFNESNFTLLPITGVYGISIGISNIPAGTNAYGTMPSSYNNFELYIKNSRIFFDIYDRLGNKSSVDTSINADDWNHVAVGWNTTNIRLYINGTLAAEKNASLNITFASPQFTVGSDNDNQQNANSYIDDFVIYNHARTLQQINKSYRRSYAIYGLNGSNFVKNDNISVKVIPHDFYEAGQTNNGSTIIQNIAPNNVTTLNIDIGNRVGNATPAAAWTAAADIDGDTITYIVYINGTQDSNTTSTSTTLGQTTTLRNGTQYEWWLQTYDGTDYGFNSSRDLFQMDNPPNITFISINATIAYENSSLNCSVFVVDADNDPVTINFTWHINGSRNWTYDVSKTALPGLIYTDKLLPNSSFRRLDNITCSAIAYDGNMTSQARNSSNLTISNTIPTIPSLTTPEDSATIVYNDDAFDWSDSVDNDADAVTYALEFSNQTDFAFLQLNKTGISGSAYRLNGSLSEELLEGAGYWRVRAYDSLNYSSYTDYRTGTIVVAAINITYPANNLVVYALTNISFTISETVRQNWTQNVTLIILNQTYYPNTTGFDTRDPAENISVNWTYSNFQVPLLNPQVIHVQARGFNNSNSSLYVTSTINIRLTRPVGAAVAEPRVTSITPSFTNIEVNKSINISVSINTDTMLDTLVTKIRDTNNQNVTLSAFATSTQGFNYTYNYTFKLNQTGQYTITSVATDVNAQTGNRTLDVFASPVQNINLTTLRGETIKIKDYNTGGIVFNGSVANGSSVNSSAPPGEYDIEITTVKPLLTLIRANLSNETIQIMNYTDLSESLTPPTSRRSAETFQFDSAVGFRNATIVYNYSDMISSIVVEKNLEMWRAETVGGTWTQLASSVNTTRREITAFTENFSIFMVAEPTSTTTATTTTTSGGGGSTSIEFVNVSSEFYLKIEAPSPVKMLSKETVTIPVKIANTGTKNMKGITLFVRSNSSDISPSLKKRQFTELPAQAIAVTDLTLESHTKPGYYLVFIDAFAENPRGNASKIVIIDLVEEGNQTPQTRLNFARDLFNKNPECLELRELISQADQKLEAGDVEEAMKLTSDAITGCSELLRVKEIKVEKPSLVGYLSQNIVLRYGLLGGLLLMVFMLVMGYLIFAPRGKQPKSQQKGAETKYTREAVRQKIGRKEISKTNVGKIKMSKPLFSFLSPGAKPKAKKRKKPERKQLFE